MTSYSGSTEDRVEVVRLGNAAPTADEVTVLQSFERAELPAPLGSNVVLLAGEDFSDGFALGSVVTVVACSGVDADLPGGAFCDGAADDG